MFEWFVSFIVSAVISWLLTPDIEDNDQSDNDGALLNKQSNNAQIPVIYGERKVGGTRVFVETSGTDNQYLYIALVLCEGEVFDIGGVYINDILSTNSKFSGLVTINKHLGSDTQTVDTTLLSAPSWTSDHTLKGVAYLGIRLKWDREVFGSIPNIHAVVKGRKVRTFNSSGVLSTTESYSTNPVECMLDYLTNTRYGKGLGVSDFESGYTSFYNSFQVADSLVESYSGGSYINTFNCNAILSTDNTLMSNVKILLNGMRGLMPYTQGVYKLIIENTGTASFAFTEDHIVEGISITGEKKGTRYNRVIATFVNKDNNWQEDQAIYPEGGSSEETTLLAEDGGVELEKRVRLPTMTNIYQARNTAKTVVNKSRQDIKCSFLSTGEALQTSIGDIVSVSHRTPGWSAKLFRVMNLSLKADGNVIVSLSEHQDTVYPWADTGAYTVIPDTNLPDPFSVLPVTSVTVSSGENYQVTNGDGSTSPRILVAWTEPTDSFVDKYVIQVRTANGTPSEYAWDIEHTTDSTPLYITGVASGKTNDVRVKSMNTMRISSGCPQINSHTIAALVGGGSGGTTSFSQNEPPSADIEAGDIWFDTNDGNRIYRYDGTAPYSASHWIAQTGDLAGIDTIVAGTCSNASYTTKATCIAASATWTPSTTIDVGDLSDISSDLGDITGGSINIGTGKFTVDSSGNVVIKNAATGNRLEVTNNTIKVIDSTGTVRVQIGQL
jgi:hypothetical protein